MALRVTLALPRSLASSLDLDKVKAVFPYGKKDIVVQVLHSFPKLNQCT